MSLDGDLRDALLSIANETPAEPRDWPNVPDRAARIRLTRRRAQGALALGATAVVVVIGLLIVQPFGDGNHRSIVANPPTGATQATVSTSPDVATTTPVDAATDLPSAIVAITERGDLIELDPVDGALRRTIAQVAPGTLSVAITPDGRTAFVERPSTDPPCFEPGGQPNEIVAVDRATGAETPIGPGSSPTVSPDGRHLAYLGRCADGPLVVLHELDGQVGVAGPSAGLFVRGLDAYAPTSDNVIGPLSFAADSIHLLGHARVDGVIDAWIVDTAGATVGETARADATVVPAMPPGPLSGRLVAERYLGDTGLLGLACFCDAANVYTLDPTTGRPAGQGIVFGTNGVVPGEQSWSLVDSDRAGRNLLLVVRHDDSTLHLERVVTRDPEARTGSPRVRLADGIVSAAWVS
jgi:hypothetical protein